ncbi:MAG: hypothetical protein LPD71_13945 [Shewanella sp.]|nr:hypothetical protein [Shewanella sp.]MCF1431989.1 hypothetical protein [Shewanella sp.]MCF1439793.1 hypothetical protein [Shewanella sp.]MCF1458299.1 hypothetical protein [Shewanella sp.]
MRGLVRTFLSHHGLDDVQSNIQERQALLTGSVRDAGKLSAEPRALLANAERELLSLNQSLQAYAQDEIAVAPNEAIALLQFMS